MSANVLARLPESKKNIILVGMTLLCLAFSNWLTSHLSVILSPSIPYKLTFISGGTIRPYDYAQYDLRHPLLGDKTSNITKQVACIHPQHLVTRGRQLFCSGVPLGEAKTHTLDGRPMPLFQFNGEIPEGKAYLRGQGKDSFDSRYWGLVDIHELTKVVPLL